MLVLKPFASGVRFDELAFAPDGKALAAAGGRRGVMVWRAFANGAKAECISAGVPAVCRLAFAPDGTLFAGNSQLVAVDFQTGGASPISLTPWGGLWFGASPEGSRLIVSGPKYQRNDYYIACWALGAYAKPLWEVTADGHVGSGPLFLPGGNRFVLCEHRRHGTPHWFGNRVTYSLKTGAELDVSACLQDTIERAVLSPDGARVACRTRETIRIYPTVGDVLDFATVKNDSKKHFTGMAFHPSGKYFAATSNDKTVKLYDTTTWDVARAFTWDIGRMRSVCFSPDGALAAAGSDSGKVVMWDVDV